jgi:hypothetical protein
MINEQKLRKILRIHLKSKFRNKKIYFPKPGHQFPRPTTSVQTQTDPSHQPKDQSKEITGIKSQIFEIKSAQTILQTTDWRSLIKQEIQEFQNTVHDQLLLHGNT